MNPPLRYVSQLKKTNNMATHYVYKNQFAMLIGQMTLAFA